MKKGEEKNHLSSGKYLLKNLVDIYHSGGEIVNKKIILLLIILIWVVINAHILIKYGPYVVANSTISAASGVALTWWWFIGRK